MSYRPYEYQIGETVFSKVDENTEMTVLTLHCRKNYKKFFFVNKTEYIGHLCEWIDKGGNKISEYFHPINLTSKNAKDYYRQINKFFSDNGLK